MPAEPVSTSPAVPGLAPETAPETVPRRIGWMRLLAVACLYAFAVETLIGWQQLWGPLSGLGAAVLLLAYIALLGAHALRSWRLQRVLANHLLMTPIQAMRVVAAHTLLTLALPLRSGEFTLPWLLRSYGAVPAWTVLGKLARLRLLDAHVLGGLALMLSAAFVTPLAWVACAAWLLLPWILRSPGRRVALHIARHVAHRLRDRPRPASAWGALLAGLHGPAQDRTSVALSWGAWSLKFATLGAVAAKLSGWPLGQALLAVCGGELSWILPLAAPGGAGTYEIGFTLPLLQFPADTEGAFAAAVTVHVLALFASLLNLSVCVVLEGLAGGAPHAPTRTCP